MNNLINKQTALEEFWKLDIEVRPSVIDAITNMLKTLPSAQPEQRWIPCSERLPEKDGYYLTTTYYRQVYADHWSEDHFDRTETVIAWMPLPEPYKEVKE